MHRPGTTLLERERELDALEALVGRLADGVGGLVAIEGPAGIGKTALLDAARERATQEALRVLYARGGELELDDQFGVVRQLFGPPLSPRLVGEIPEAAAAVLGAGDAGAAPPGEDAAHAAHHALFELTARLAVRSPVLVILDDAHWADRRSLRWLVFLARRLDRAPVGILLARRTGEHGADPALLDRVISGSERSTLLSPSALTVDAASLVVRESLGEEAHDGFCAACCTATAGNPFLLGELVAELRSSGVEPVDSAVKATLSIGPESVARATLLRLSRAPDGAVPLARALSVMEEAELRDVARLAELDEARARELARALAEAGLLDDGPQLRFAHPLVRAAIYRELDSFERVRAHRVAAFVLADRGGSLERTAAHLLLAEPAGEARVVELLRAAARRAYSGGAPEAAARYLRRALEEPPGDEERGGVLLELGRAEVRASEPGATAHLQEARDAVGAGAPRARVLRELARAHMKGGEMELATHVFGESVASAGGDRELALAIEGELAATLANVAGAADAERLLERHRDLPGSTPAERTVLAVLAFAAAQGNAPAPDTAALMGRVLRGGDFVAEQTAATVVFADAIFALILAGDERVALECLDQAAADARRLGWTIGLAAAPFYQAWAALRLGDLQRARGYAEQALEISDERGWQAFTPMAGAVLCEVEIERAELAGARAALERAGVPEEIPDSALFQLALYARGLLRAAEGRTRAALADLLLCGERELALGGVTPAGMAWRSRAALLHDALGEHDAASGLAHEELELARVLGTPRALGVALQVTGTIDDDANALEEAVQILADGVAPLEHARAQVALGSARRRANQRRDARAPLRAALATADALGAAALAQRARDELLAAGGRPRRAALSGPRRSPRASCARRGWLRPVAATARSRVSWW